MPPIVENVRKQGFRRLAPNRSKQSEDLVVWKNWNLPKQRATRSSETTWIEQTCPVLRDGRTCAMLPSTFVSSAPPWHPRSGDVSSLSFRCSDARKGSICMPTQRSKNAKWQKRKSQSCCMTHFPKAAVCSWDTKLSSRNFDFFVLQRKSVFLLSIYNKVTSRSLLYELAALNRNKQ